MSYSIKSFKVKWIFVSLMAVFSFFTLEIYANLSLHNEHIKNFLTFLTSSQSLKQSCSEDTFTFLVPPVEEYFDTSKVSPACAHALKKSIDTIPEEFRLLLANEAKKSKEKFFFTKMDSEEAARLQYAGTIIGTPGMFAKHKTIFTTSDYCVPYGIDATIIHEIGHIIHNVLKEQHPDLAKEWKILWQDIHKKNHSPSPFRSQFCENYFNDCPFIGWKDVDNHNEGFAQLVLLSTPTGWSRWKNNAHPDFLRKVKFMKQLITKLDHQKPF